MLRSVTELTMKLADLAKHLASGLDVAGTSLLPAPSLLSGPI